MVINAQEVGAPPNTHGGTGEHQKSPQVIARNSNPKIEKGCFRKETALFVVS